MKLSIIIPVYGVEQYIEKCLLSIFEQDLPESEYEVIIINDGTKDKSWDIVERFCEGHSNAKLYKQLNQGLSATRNRGLEIAKGDYIWFVDSDDWIDSHCLASLVDAVEGYDVLALAKMYEEGDWTGIKKYNVCKDVSDKLAYLSQDYPTPAQFYICRRQYLLDNNFRFKVGIKHEDCLFTPLIVVKAEKFSVYHKPVYHFLKRPNSITTVIDNKRGYDYCYIINSLYDYRCFILNKLLLDKFDAFIARIIKAHLSLAYLLDSQTQEYIENFYKKNNFFLCCLKKSKINSRLVYYLYKYTPFKLVKIYKTLEVVWKTIK